MTKMGTVMWRMAAEASAADLLEGMLTEQVLAVRDAHPAVEVGMLVVRMMPGLASNTGAEAVIVTLLKARTGPSGDNLVCLLLICCR
ncbi:MAG: hypothetical protein HC872_00125 [Gammaproteobacteria bacterium]|nr:hypothetical protein [Gammaproteobacteria bacterium]